MFIGVCLTQWCEQSKGRPGKDAMYLHFDHTQLLAIAVCEQTSLCHPVYGQTHSRHPLAQPAAHIQAPEAVRLTSCIQPELS
ncbi:hypothetical protein LDENG_00289640 [Lucifuga dentata]|nr:hypothetical protein LDENG_00289640 [Lucifuga dentata]